MSICGQIHFIGDLLYKINTDTTYLCQLYNISEHNNYFNYMPLSYIYNYNTVYIGINLEFQNELVRLQNLDRRSSIHFFHKLLICFKTYDMVYGE